MTGAWPYRAVIMFIYIYNARYYLIRSSSIRSMTFLPQSLFFVSENGIRLPPSPTVNGFTRYALAEIDVENAFEKSIHLA